MNSTIIANAQAIIDAKLKRCQELEAKEQALKAEIAALRAEIKLEKSEIKVCKAEIKVAAASEKKIKKAELAKNKTIAKVLDAMITKVVKAKLPKEKKLRISKKGLVFSNAPGSVSQIKERKKRNTKTSEIPVIFDENGDQIALRKYTKEEVDELIADNGEEGVEIIDLDKAEQVQQEVQESVMGYNRILCYRNRIQNAKSPKHLEKIWNHLEAKHNPQGYDLKLLADAVEMKLDEFEAPKPEEIEPEQVVVQEPEQRPEEIEPEQVVVIQEPEQRPASSEEDFEDEEESQDFQVKSPRVKVTLSRGLKKNKAQKQLKNILGKHQI